MRTPQLEKNTLSHRFFFTQIGNQMRSESHIRGSIAVSQKITLAVLDRVQNRYCGQSRGNGCITVLELKTSFLEDLAQKFMFI